MRGVNGAIDAQGHSVASREFAGDRTCDGGCGRLRFDQVDDVIRSHSIDRETRGGTVGPLRVNYVVVRRCHITNVAVHICGGNACFNFCVAVDEQLCRGDADAEHTTGVDRASEWFLVDGEGHHVTHFELTCHSTTHGGVDSHGFCGSDDVVCGDAVNHERRGC